MVVQYQGEQKGIPTTFTIKIIKDNTLKKGSHYQMLLGIGNTLLPIYKTSFHKSLSQCVNEMYLFRKYNHIVLNAASEEVMDTYIPIDSIKYHNFKSTLFLA